VLDGRCAVGIWEWGLVARAPHLTHEPLLTSGCLGRFATASLASRPGPIPTGVLAEQYHLVHIDPADCPSRRIEAAIPRVSRLSHLEPSSPFLRAGLGFGRLPMHVIEADLATAPLVRLRPRPRPGGLRHSHVGDIPDRQPTRAGWDVVHRSPEAEDIRWLQVKRAGRWTQPPSARDRTNGSLA